jgi:putative ABC transport system ATP-binding protein
MSEDVLIEVKDVSKYYEDGKVIALNSINLKIIKGEFLVIKGPSGSGKSTLLHLLGGLDSPTKGEIYFDGKRIKDLNKASRLFRINNIGFVFQAFYLWSTLNVLENVSLPLMESNLKKKERLKRAKSLIDMMGLTDKYFSLVGNLSVGERQRVAIARALAMESKVLLADEPTGSLDSKNKENILDIFKRINKENGTTIVMATHEIAVASFFNRSIKLLDGRIVS